jgi:hypothetical protein
MPHAAILAVLRFFSRRCRSPLRRASISSHVRCDVSGGLIIFRTGFFAGGGAKGEPRICVNLHRTALSKCSARPSPCSVDWISAAAPDPLPPATPVLDFSRHHNACTTQLPS